ncbi:YcgN family cysteine cluster protein [Falsirhodobacter sp. 20TX0035]|uniref:YcgN family cysteine cluster protein n=1 Tax=Falsirhodobacter sp. 20TX0035 TaxID=3022019 RepID=UPI00232F71C6|nr:YcgN family cysteine cluster protein [Falsirhodobacter sp. 20TX0035]MDB6453804.1 YcgN family cysteine cluster protein [Falsirhodobacter sp. 20TX0035]
MRDKFWETVKLKNMTPQEWEALCDGCGKCCLNKIEFEDTNEIAFTRVACKLLDGTSCFCSKYETRRDYVPDCVQLTPKKLPEIAYWLPRTCAYRRLHEGKPLPDWHHLITGDRESIHRAQASVRGWTVPEYQVSEEDWEDYLIEETP